MANVDGSWDTLVRSPMGDQKATLTIASSGDTFTGTYSGAMGNAEIKDGKVDGDKLTWKLDISVPMPMTLDAEATVDGDAITGTVTAGAFGAFPLTGTRLG
ncbi:hypothetical protein [Sphingomonas sp. G-3-2-10]|jgi:hypothetical protein|uniref:hypothetical protein n=1 Tax=Sphingomonas sp. G-3-2-10 TaxID=2728838 RepID=UPI00146A5D4C|nr:hypothetical protein [Sphingomonas sp. G-3-2-10]NML07032.1 hypothetical protein [Sphingomonas sp. G-3-2-10]